MRKKRIARIAALLIALCMVNLTPTGAVSGAEPEYIVKYRKGAVRQMDDTLPFAVVGEGEMKRLRKAGLLEWYEPDGTAVLLDSVYYESEQWNLDMVGAEGAFQAGALGQGVRVGVLDSGISPHEAFGDRLLPGRNYMEDAADECDTADTFGHGTAVAGLIAGVGEGGYIGTAPGAALVPLKVTNGKDVKISAICRAIYGGIDDFGCLVLNLSLGVSTDYESLREAVDYAEEKGVIIVAASGNDGTSTLYYPAGYDSVIGVSAVDRNGSIYLHSSHNSGVSIAVPGVDLRSTGSAGGYAYFSGTSFAVPQVSGAAAVLLGIDPTLTPAQVLELLTGTATDRGDAGYDKYYGCGILNLGACVEALTGGTIPLPDGHSEEVTEPSEWKTGYQDCLRDDSCELSANSDLDSRNWYHDGIHFCLENGMMKGMGDGIFDPNGATSRAMIVTILYRLEGEPDMAGEEEPFSDVEDGQWYADAVIWAAENGVVEGYDDGTFRPTADITREQLAVILYRCTQSKGDGFTGEWEFSLHYPDATEISNWADEAIRWMVMKGIVGGKDGLLVPGGDATRAESATMLMRYCMLDVE